MSEEDLKQTQEESGSLQNDGSDTPDNLAEERGKGMGVGGPRQGDGGTSTCKCPQCGKTFEHQRGTPCNTKQCPTCNVALVGA